MNFSIEKLGIRPEEKFRATMMFSYIFLVIASLLIVKPVRNSLFLTHFGVSQLPYAFILVAVASIIVVSAYAHVTPKIRLDRIILGTTIISVFCLLFFWIFLHWNYGGGWLYYLFYVWVAIFGVIITTQFWLLANYVFNAREAKRLFSFIGAGAISGGIFGGYLTKYLSSVLHTNQLILISIVFLLLTIPICRIIWKKSARYSYSEKLIQQKRIGSTQTRQDDSVQDSPLKLILDSPHLTTMACLVGISVIVANLVDYQFNAIATEVIHNEDQLTAFFGFWMSNLSIVSLGVQLFLTGRILQSVGIGASLFFLPVGILIGASAILFHPALWSAVMIKISDGGFKQSINKVGLEVLALPIPVRIKNQVKAFIDVFVDNLATGIGGLLLLLFTVYFGFKVQHISLIIIGLIGLWSYLIVRVKREYINSFRTAIEKRTIDIDDQTINLSDASVWNSIITVLNNEINKVTPNERRILYILKLLKNVRNDDLIPCLQRLIHHPSDDVKAYVLKMARQYDNLDLTDQTTHLIHNNNDWMIQHSRMIRHIQNVRIQAIAYLSDRSTDPTGNLRHFLEHPDYRIQTSAMLCAARKIQAGMLRYDDTDTVDYFRWLLNGLKDRPIAEQEFIKITLARCIGLAPNPNLYSYLQSLLKDDSVEVVQAAVVSAGLTRAELFIPMLISHLHIKQIRRFAQEALAAYDESIIDRLLELFDDPGESHDVQMVVPKILALIGSQVSVEVLIERLDTEDMMLRYQIIKALNKLRTKFSMLTFGRNRINRMILDEIHHYHETLIILHQYKNVVIRGDHNDNVKRAEQLLIKALRERLDDNLERIFRLLGLRYHPKDMFNAYLGIISQKSDLRANAVEFLDNVLDHNLKKWIIPIAETESLTALTNRMNELDRVHSSSEDYITTLLKGKDNWLRVCALYYVAQTQTRDCLTLIESLTDDSDLVVRETAEYACHRILRTK
ncbi:MAG: Npt1/Npt2 family nucleotide transporter [Candidatus Electryoneaceae bacterium]|nr:Npt1/Npt2 family nucleotide transporter [Candidatus Electryoneaceae bacterium]